LLDSARFDAIKKNRLEGIMNASIRRMAAIAFLARLRGFDVR
jgi:hypothetical protein